MEKKLGVSLLLILLSLSLVSAINLKVSPVSVQNSYIVDINEPAVFDLNIENLEGADTFQIYSLIGVDISPQTFSLTSKETKTVRISIIPRKSLQSDLNSLTFEYKIKNSKEEIQDEKLTMNIITLNQAFAITPDGITPTSKKINVQIENKLNYDFTDLKIRLNSIFFDKEETISLPAHETKNIEIALDSQKVDTLEAGQYILTATLTYKNAKTEIESLLNFLEQDGIQATETVSGTFIKKNEITKENVGNTKKTVEILIKRNVISYLFTTFNKVPTETNREGLTINYIWRDELAPKEKLTVSVTTNWFYPIIVIILAIVLFILIKKSTEMDLTLKKQVSFVKTRGGEFALKVSIRVKAKKFIQKINITDRLPHLVELYDRFGAVHPDKIDLKNKRLEWNIESLNAGEERIFSYIIYSKIGVVGKFELPFARAVYEKDNQVKESMSNRSFFINEPKRMKEN